MRTSTNPDYSVCIPNYKRFDQLITLLQSIISASYSRTEDIEVLITDDNSPDNHLLPPLIENLQLPNNLTISLHFNPLTIGYDRNLRKCISHARGTYIVFYGNDDIMPTTYFSHVAEILSRDAQPSGIIRSYQTFDRSPSVPCQTFRYTRNHIDLFPSDESFAYVFKRSVVISGLVLRRDICNSLHTDVYDGLLLYQVYLFSKATLHHAITVTPHILALYRTGGIPSFGTSSRETRHTPGIRTPDSSITFISGYLDLAKRISTPAALQLIVKDLSKYSWPLFDIQSGLRFRQRFNYFQRLTRLGLWITPYYPIYALVYLLGLSRLFNIAIHIIRTTIGHTPQL